MKIVRLNEIPQDEMLSKEWNELVFQMEQPEVFYTYEWAMAASTEFSTAATPLLILIYDDASLVGIAALATSSQTSGQVHFLCDKTGDYCDFVSRPTERLKVLEEVLQELRRLGKSQFVMSSIPGNSVTRECICAVSRKLNYYLIAGDPDVYPRVILGDLNDRAALRQVLNRKKSVRNLYKALSKMGPVEILHSKDGVADQKYLSDFFDAHIARFLATGRISPYVRLERRRFLLTVSELLAAKGWLTASELSVSKRIIAWHIGFEFCGKSFWYMPTFDIDYERFGPGMHLLKSFLERAIDQPSISVVDMGYGDEGYKKRFANSQQHINQLIITNSWGRYLRLLTRNIFRKNVKRSQRIERWVRSCAGLMIACSERFHKEGALALIREVLKRFGRVLYSNETLAFFQGCNGKFKIEGKKSMPEVKLKSLDWAILAKAAMWYEKDKETLSYLVRAGERLFEGKAQGFVVVSEKDVPLHFCWVSDYNGFFVGELQTRLKESRGDSVVIFDCWTPMDVRGQGFYPEAIKQVARRFSGAGKTSWILSSIRNSASIQGIQKSGFNQRFLTTSHKVLNRKVMVKTKFVGAESLYKPLGAEVKQSTGITTANPMKSA